MTEPYLLAASLLTGLAIPPSTLPDLPTLPDDYISLFDLIHNFQTSDGEKITPKMEVAVPEFSNEVAISTNSSSTTKRTSKLDISLPEFSSVVISNINRLKTPLEESRRNYNQPISNAKQDKIATPIKSSFNSNVTTPKFIPISGNQLFYYRLAALRTGQIYTRMNNDHIDLSWITSKQYKLTYQDWKNLLALEARAVSRGQGNNRLSILLGDSLSLWFPKDKLPSGKLWLNQGISGDTSAGVFKRLSAFSHNKAEVIYLMVGINDLRKGATDQSILQNSRNIIKQLRRSHPQSQIVIQSILPVRSQKIANSRIRHINSKLSIIARQESVNYLNIHSWFTDDDGSMRRELTTDGLHLSKAGYRVWQLALDEVEYRVASL